MKDFIIGIDPGKNGGIVGLTNGKINIIDKMPQQPTDLWGYFIDVLGIPMMNKENIYVFIEDVHSMPTDGSKSAFTFGRGLGWLDMPLAYYGLRTERVIPRKWMESYGLKRRKDVDPETVETKYQYKKRIKERAQVLAPEHQRENITLATCDAYLIALYGYHKLKEEQRDERQRVKESTE